MYITLFFIVLHSSNKSMCFRLCFYSTVKVFYLFKITKDDKIRSKYVDINLMYTKIDNYFIRAGLNSCSGGPLSRCTLQKPTKNSKCLVKGFDIFTQY